MCRSQREPEWQPEDERHLRRLLPLLAASIERTARWERLRAERDLYASALDRTTRSPMLLFDGAGRLAWMSRSAVALLTSRLGRRGALDEPFRAAVHGLLALHESPELPRTITLELTAGQPDSSVRAALFWARTDEGGEPYVVVALEERNAPPEVLTRSADEFGLTKAEAAVVRELLRGSGTAEIGTRLFIARDTVRTHLKRVYEKMNVHSRVELLAKIRSLPAL
jgi:DNA-binding CsgD family transcriptional regulator